MRRPEFEYLRPKSVEEACTIVEEASGEALPVPGGTGLLVGMKQRVATSRYLVDLKGLPASTAKMC